jgi:hypothetical protein
MVTQGNRNNIPYRKATNILGTLLKRAAKIDKISLFNSKTI